MQNLSFLRGKFNRNVILEGKILFNIWVPEKKFRNKIEHVYKILFQNLTCSNTFWIQIRRVVKKFHLESDTL